MYQIEYFKCHQTVHLSKTAAAGYFNSTTLRLSLSKDLLRYFGCPQQAGAAGSGIKPKSPTFTTETMDYTAYSITLDIQVIHAKNDSVCTGGMCYCPLIGPTVSEWSECGSLSSSDATEQTQRHTTNPCWSIPFGKRLFNM